MAEILFVRESPLGRFYVHRVSRILPSLWLFVLSMVIAGHFVGRLDITWPDVLATLTFTQNYFYSPNCFGHIWSLCIEEHAYILLSLIAIFHRRRRAISIFAICFSIAVAMALNGMVQTYYFHSEGVYRRSDVRICSVLISAALYLRFRYQNVPSFIPLTSILVGFAIFLVGSVPDIIRYTVATTLISIGLATADCLPKLILASLSFGLLRFFGLLSYTLYLWQQPFTHYEGYSLPILLTTLFSTSIAVFFGFERPLRSAVNLAWDRHRKTGQRVVPSVDGAA